MWCSFWCLIQNSVNVFHHSEDFPECQRSQCRHRAVVSLLCYRIQFNIVVQCCTSFMLEGYCIYPTVSSASGRETHGREYLRLLLPWRCQKGHAGKSLPCQKQRATFTALEEKERGLWRELIQISSSLAITPELRGLSLFTYVMLGILGYTLLMVPK